MSKYDEVLETRLAYWPIDKIVPYELNSKVHDKAQVKKIVQSIAEFGWDQPIVIDKDGVIIKGHGRRLAAIELGMKRVPVLVRDDLSPEQVRAARLADNRVAVGDIDPELLRQELASLEFEMKGIFDDKELEFLSTDLALVNEDAFVTDIDAELKRTNEATAAAHAEIIAKPIPIAKAFGFKSVPGEAEHLVTRFMAQIQADTGLAGGDAFVAFIKGLME